MRLRRSEYTPPISLADPTSYFSFFDLITITYISGIADPGNVCCRNQCWGARVRRGAEVKFPACMSLAPGSRLNAVPPPIPKTTLIAVFCCPNCPVRYTADFTFREVTTVMNLNQTVTPSPEVISQEVSGETVLLDLDSEHYFGLDEIGTRIWQLIRESGDLRIIYSTLLEEYEVEEERLRTDLDALLGEITDLGLVTMRAAA